VMLPDAAGHVSAVRERMRPLQQVGAESLHSVAEDASLTRAVG